MPENLNDLAIPEIKLVQNTGGDEAKQLGAKPGDFYCAITQEIINGTEGFDFVIIKPAQKTRTYWGTTEISEEPPTCASPDGITSVNGDACESACPYQAFTDAPYMVAATERRTKCLPNYNVIGIKVSDMMPAMIRCSGISAMAARELNTLLKFHKVMRGQAYKAQLRVTAVKKKTASGEAFAIKFGQPELIHDPGIVAELHEQALALTGIEAPALEALPEPVTPAIVPAPEKTPENPVKATASKIKF